MTSKSEEGRRRARARMVGRYANAFQVGFNAFELVVEFGESFSRGEAAQVHTRIVTNPIFAQALLRTLSDSLREYERSYGEIVARADAGTENQ